MFQLLFPVLLTVGKVLICSLAIYLAIRFFAYKRSFPIPRRYDFLWIIDTLLILCLVLFSHPFFQNDVPPKLFTWTSFITFLLSCYLLIFVIDQFAVEYFLVTVLKMYVSPPLRKVILLFVFALSVLVGVQRIFNINPLAVYGTSSILFAGIGFALKDMLQTFFASVALSRMIHIGDWIRVTDKEGEVIDINWARTVLRTWDGNHFFVPNSELQKESFQSFSYPTSTVRCRLEIGTSYDTPPQKVKRVLTECAQNVERVLHSPVPEVLLVNYADFAVQYNLTFWINDYSHRQDIMSEVSTRVWYAFQREGIEIPYPIRTVHLTRKSKEAAVLEPETLLSSIDLFKDTPTDIKQLILDRLKKQVYLKGEIIVREGEYGTSFFIVLKGRLEVLKRQQEKMLFIGDLKAGQFFGELSLLTGEPRTATVRALTDSELLRLEKEDFQEIMEQHPDLAEVLAGVVASRQAKLAEHNIKGKTEPVPVQSKKSSLSNKIREFFNLKERV